MIPYAEIQEPSQQDEIVDGPGWRRVTPAGSKGRHYEDTAPSCDIAEATEEHFDSVSHLLRVGWATDFTGPAKANVTKFAWENAAYLAQQRQLHDQLAVAGEHARAEDVRKRAGKALRNSADVSLNEAADRGSSIHRALEALLGGEPLDRDDLTRNGAYPWLLAVQSFIIEAQPEPVELEVVGFDRVNMAAGTADFVGYLRGIPAIADLLIIADWKSRTDGHPRRQKEGVQGGAYATMLTDGYYMNDRGRRCRLPIDGAVIVTFAPDGTWRWHLVDLDAAKRAYAVAVEEARLNKVSVMFPDRSKDHGPFDIADIATRRIAAIPDGTSHKMWLAKRWTELALPKVPELTAEHWPQVDSLLAAAEEPFKAFETKPTKPREYVDLATVAGIARRMMDLPKDLLEGVERAGASLPDPRGARPLTAEDVEDWERVLGPAEASVGARMSEAVGLLEQIRELGDDLHLAVTAHLTVDGGAANWSEADFAAAEVLILGVEAGVLTPDPDFEMLIPHPTSEEKLAGEGKRAVVAKAKDLHETYGRPKPTKWADLVADPILWAAVATAA